MSQHSNTRVLAATVLVLAMLCSSAQAQNAPAPIMTCAAASNMNVDMTQFDGIWYEVARSPAISWNCVELNIYQKDANTWAVNTTYASMSNMLYMNSTVSSNITLLPPATQNNNQNTVPAGFNITSNYTGQPQNVTLKVLATDLTGYAFICGYTNSSDDTTSFGVILTRQRQVNTTMLNKYESMAAQNYTNFPNGTMSVLTQTDACTYNLASRSVPILSAFFALFYALFKIIN